MMLCCSPRIAGCRTHQLTALALSPKVGAFWWRAEMGIDRSTAWAHGSPMLRVDAGGVESARARSSDPAGSVGANLPISAQIGYSSSYHFTTAVAIDGAGSVRRQTGIKTARTLPVDSGGAGSRPATNCAQNPPPALAAIQTHCCSDHRHAWRCNADPDVNLEKKEVRMILKEPHARAA